MCPQSLVRDLFNLFAILLIIGFRSVVELSIWRPQMHGQRSSVVTAAEERLHYRQDVN